MKPVVVVGSGFGGLAAAVRLRAMGHHVVVLEAQDQPGGRAAVFERDGFRFDAGPTVITAPYLLEELFTLVGRNASDYYDLVPVDPFYRVKFPDGSAFDYVGDEERLLAQIREFNPKDVDGYRRLAAQSKAIFDVGYTQLADAPFDRLSDMLRITPQMIKLQSYRTVYGLVASFLKDERLRQAFTFQPLLVGGNPFDTTSIYLLIHWLERKWGVWFAKGGTHQIVKSLVQLLEEIGVETRLNCPVSEIEVKDGRAVAVRTEAGERIECEAVVSNADPSWVYSKMIDVAHRPSHGDRRIARRKPSMSLFVAYFGTKKLYPDTRHHTILLGPRYKGLLNDIFHKKVLAEDFSLYLHAPTRTDPSMAPAGHEAFYVLSPVPNQRSGIDWEQEGPRYLDRILNFLDQGELPGLRENLVSMSTVDPRYFAGPLRSVDGAAFGIEPIFSQSAWFRYHNRAEDVQGLYFVGASTHPGAGVPGVLNSARVMEKVMQSPEHALPVPKPRPQLRWAQ